MSSRASSGFAGRGAQFDGELSPEDLFNMFFGGGGGGGFGPGFATSFGGGPSTFPSHLCYALSFKGTNLQRSLPLVAMVSKGKRTRGGQQTARKLLNRDPYLSNFYLFFSCSVSHCYHHCLVYSRHHPHRIPDSPSSLQPSTTRKWRQED